MKTISTHPQTIGIQRIPCTSDEQRRKRGTRKPTHQPPNKPPRLQAQRSAVASFRVIVKSPRVQGRASKGKQVVHHRSWNYRRIHSHSREYKGNAWGKFIARRVYLKWQARSFLRRNYRHLTGNVSRNFFSPS